MGKVIICKVCHTELTFEDDDEIKNCDVCNAIIESDILVQPDVLTFKLDYNNTTVHGGRKVMIDKKKRISHNHRKLLLKTAKPWKIENLFHYIFQLQVNAVKPYIQDDTFQQICNNLWNKYIDATGARHNILNMTLDRIRISAFPLGWGSYYEPKKGMNRLESSTHEYKKRRLDHGYEDFNPDEDSTEELLSTTDRKVKRVAKKTLKIIHLERMLIMKRRDLEIEKELNGEDKQIEINVDLDAVDGAKSEFLDNFGLLTKDDSDYETDSEDHDEQRIKLDELTEREEEIRRILSKRPMSQIRFAGSSSTSGHSYMSMNICLLYIAISFAKSKDRDCTLLSDLIRLIHQRKIPYKNILSLIPRDQFIFSDRYFGNILRRDFTPSYERLSTEMYHLLSILNIEDELPCLDIADQITRLIQKLNLPSNLVLYTNALTHLSYKVLDRHLAFNRKRNCTVTQMTKSRRYRFFFMIDTLVLAYIFHALNRIFKLHSNFMYDFDAIVSKIPNNYFSILKWIDQEYKGVTQYTSNYHDQNDLVEYTSDAVLPIVNPDNKNPDFNSFGRNTYRKKDGPIAKDTFLSVCNLLSEIDQDIKKPSKVSIDFTNYIIGKPKEIRERGLEMGLSEAELSVLNEKIANGIFEVPKTNYGKTGLETRKKAVKRKYESQNEEEVKCDIDRNLDDIIPLSHNQRKVMRILVHGTTISMEDLHKMVITMDNIFVYATVR